MFTIFKDLERWFTNTFDECRDLIKEENSPQDKSPFGYYTLKMIPVSNAVVDFFDIFDTYSDYNRY